MARKLLAALVLGAVVPVTLTVTDKKKLKFSASVTGADAVAHDVVDSGGSIRRFSDVDTVVKGVLDNRASVTSVDVTIDTTEVKKQRIPTDPVAEATRLKTKYTSAKATAVSTKAKIDANLLQIAVYQTMSA